MLRIVVLVSGGGTNLQAIIELSQRARSPNAQIVGVISNNKTVKSLERARNAGIPAVCVSPKDYESREVFNDALLAKVKEFTPDLIVLAGFLVKIPEAMVHEYSNRIINIHPSLIPSFCGVGYYGLHVHEKALERGVKVTGATVHFVNEAWMKALSLHRKQWQWKMMIPRKAYRDVSWNRLSGCFCLRRWMTLPTDGSAS